MELTVVLGVMLLGTVPRNGLGENGLPKAPRKPCTDTSPLPYTRMVTTGF